MTKLVGIHQPHYFPWLGYLDKMAKVDEFIILDDVQLTDCSPMVRNKFLQIDGTVKYLTVSTIKKGYLEKKTSEIELVNWNKVRKKHEGFIEANYKKTPFYDEIFPYIENIFTADFRYLFEVEMATIKALRDIFGIDTPITLQSSLEYDLNAKKNDLVISLCKAVNASMYLSGNGAKKYMNEKLFNTSGINICYQQFNFPSYPQYRQTVFVPNLSALDMAFQCGIKNARKIFRENMQYEQAL